MLHILAEIKAIASVTKKASHSHSCTKSVSTGCTSKVMRPSGRHGEQLPDFCLASLKADADQHKECDTAQAVTQDMLLCGLLHNIGL